MPRESKPKTDPKTGPSFLVKVLTVAGVIGLAAIAAGAVIIAIKKRKRG